MIQEFGTLTVGILFTIIGLAACTFYRWRRAKAYPPLIIGLFLIYLATIGPISHSQERIATITDLDPGQVVGITLQHCQYTIDILYLYPMDEFEQYLRARTDLNDGDIDYILSHAIHKHLRRNEFLLREGDICRYKIFVTKGLLRTFGTAADGSEHILQFAPEHSWTLDVESYDRQQPAHSNIAAIESSEVLLWPKTVFDNLLSTIPQLKDLARQLISGNIYNSRQRILTALSATPEEKYQEFIQNFPNLLTRLPLHMIASYLGISIKTLTRIRQAQLRR